ncbi:MAG: metallophosphoesterase family protein [Acidimicrobiales bacterium]
MDVEPEVTTVADDEIVIHVGSEVRSYAGLAPNTTYDLDGIVAHTLARPPGERLSVFTTVNDVHFGEVECGVIDGLELGPILRAEPGDPPYPEVMNRAAVAEMSDLRPDAVVVKGDLTANGTVEEYDAFLAAYEPAFGERLHHVRGNHDAYLGAEFGAISVQEVALPGVTLAILDTVIPRHHSGRLLETQLEWLDELGARADGPVVVLGHHHPWDPGSNQRPEDYFGINPTDSEALVEVLARRPTFLGYFAGHTHRNRVRHFAATGKMPIVEVACVKDFPGSWAEYRVFEGGILQVHRRISSRPALAWTDRTREMFLGQYAQYSFGQVTDRCFELPGLASR